MTLMRHTLQSFRAVGLCAIVLGASVLPWGCSKQDKGLAAAKSVDLRSGNKCDKGGACEANLGNVTKAESLLSLDKLLESVQPLSDEAAIKYLISQCATCHDTKTGSVPSFWPMELDSFSKQTLIVDTAAPKVFASVLFKARDLMGTKPEPMPLGQMSPEAKAQLLPLVKWMTIEMPAAVQDALPILSGSELKNEIGNVGVILNFKCTQPSTAREFIRRLINDAFSREPLESEFKLATGPLDDPVSEADRRALSARILSDAAWKAEFEGKTLRKFANKLSGSGSIKPFDSVISAVQADDLKQEFYQLLLTAYDKTSYRDILLGSDVMVTPNTAALYGCQVPQSGWTPCTMASPRGSYFTTFGYLRSKPSSFLNGNNNYGRAALMQYVLKGDVLKPGLDGVKGGADINPLPACLKTKDFRGEKGSATVAWMGSSAIPMSANLCQSCHIDRHMAAGSILFRPFNVFGKIYGKDANIDSSDPDFATATSQHMVNQLNLTGPMQAVTADFLKSLLDVDETEQACIGASSNAGNEVIMNSVKDLAAYMVGSDGRIVAGGLARHLPRALSNLSTTTEEVIVKVKEASESGKGLLAPMITAYFGTETFACKR
ncbi:MAG: hypothetical protein FJ146_06045 [Deltaproteobacteria bacterium]|nr:hypothetical protein [Deltaproteobacteria bacterium]